MKFSNIFSVLFVIVFVNYANSYQEIIIDGESFQYTKDEYGVRFSPINVSFSFIRDQAQSPPLCAEFNKSMQNELFNYEFVCDLNSEEYEKDICQSRKERIDSQRLYRLRTAFWEGNSDVKQRWAINIPQKDFSKVIAELSKTLSVRKDLIKQASVQIDAELIAKNFQFSKESWIGQMLKLNFDPPLITKYDSSTLKTIGRDIGCDIMNQQIAIQVPSVSRSEYKVSKTALNEVEILDLSLRLSDLFAKDLQSNRISLLGLANIADEIVSSVSNFSEANAVIESEKIVDLFFQNEKSNLFLNQLASKEDLKKIKYIEIKQDQFPINFIYQGLEL